MKRIVLSLGLLAVGSIAFAQQFFIDGFVNTNFESVTPNIGIGIGLNPVDIMAGMNFSINEDEFEYGIPYSNSEKLEKWNSVGVYAGIAPKPVSLEKFTLSIPLLLQIRFGGSTYERSKITVSQDELKDSSRFGIDFLLGAKVSYLLSTHWSIFSGFVFNVFEYTKWDNNYYLNAGSATGKTYSRTETASIG
ncbi:MAG: hypothetical protein LBF87_03670 [Treponema sp.]|jgi:hypothetical protein|nr:hypothetical protein [Treponema sp.]